MAAPAELELILTCARRAHRPEPADIGDAVRACTDWPEFFRLTAVHNTLPICRRVLREHPLVPDSVKEELETLHRKALPATLRLCGLLASTARVFAENGVRVIALKGPALAAQLYGDPTMRRSCDLDLFVAPADVGRADRLLRRLGFEANVPRFDRPWHRRFFMALVHEMQYVDYRRGLLIELHWRPTANPYMITLPAAWPDRTETVLVAGVEVETLDPVDQIVYLALHGAKHAWTELRWLFDLVPLVERVGSLDALRARATQLRCWDYVLEALVLLEHYLAIPLPEAWRREAIEAAAGARVVRSHRRIAGDATPDPARQLWEMGSGLRFSLYHFLMMAMQVPSDWQMFPLPAPLLPLYLPLRPVFRFLRRRRVARGYRLTVTLDEIRGESPA